KPKYLCHDCATPASTETRARTDDGRTSSRYCAGCSSNHSWHGIETTRVAVPADSSCFAASTARCTSEQVALRIKSGVSVSSSPWTYHPLCTHAAALS